MLSFEERRKQEERLRNNLERGVVELEKLAKQLDHEWAAEDAIYRFYHHSFKVYGIQQYTEQMVQVFNQLMPGVDLNEDFKRIIKEGTDKEFQGSETNHWHTDARPMIEAYFHARYFLQMLIKYARKEVGRNGEGEPDASLASGWAACLYLYGLR